MTPRQRVLIGVGAVTLAAVPVGLALMLSRDRRAAHALERACRQGDPPACLLLAERLRSGKGTRRDELRADELRAAAPAMRACESGQARACLQIARLWEPPHALADDPEHATSMKKRACDLGEPDACVAHAEARIRGSGVAADRVGGIAELARIGTALRLAKDARALAVLGRACELAALGACMEAARMHPAVRLIDPSAPAKESDATGTSRRVLLGDSPLDDLAPSATPLLELGCDQGDRIACATRARQAIELGGETAASPWFSRLVAIDDLLCNGAAGIAASADRGVSFAACARLAEVDGPPVSPELRKRAQERVLPLDEQACTARDAARCQRLVRILRLSDPKRALLALDPACKSSLIEACELAFDLAGSPGLSEGHEALARRRAYGRRVVELYELGCSKREASRCRAAGHAYGAGLFVAISHKKALRLLADACGLGELGACCEEGLMLEPLDPAGAKAAMEKGGGRGKCAPTMR